MCWEGNCAPAVENGPDIPQKIKKGTALGSGFPPWVCICESCREALPGTPVLCSLQLCSQRLVNANKESVPQRERTKQMWEYVLFNSIQSSKKTVEWALGAVANTPWGNSICRGILGFPSGLWAQLLVSAHHGRQQLLTSVAESLALMW